MVWLFQGQGIAFRVSWMLCSLRESLLLTCPMTLGLVHVHIPRWFKFFFNLNFSLDFFKIFIRKMCWISDWVTEGSNTCLEASTMRKSAMAMMLWHHLIFSNQWNRIFDYTNKTMGYGDRIRLVPTLWCMSCRRSVSCVKGRSPPVGW